MFNFLPPQKSPLKSSFDYIASSDWTTTKPYRVMFLSQRRQVNVPTAEETMATLSDPSQLLCIKEDFSMKKATPKEFLYCSYFLSLFKFDFYCDDEMYFNIGDRYLVFVFSGDADLKLFKSKYEKAIETDFHLTEYIIEKMTKISEGHYYSFRNLYDQLSKTDDEERVSRLFQSEFDAHRKSAKKLYNHIKLDELSC